MDFYNLFLIEIVNVSLGLFMLIYFFCKINRLKANARKGFVEQQQFIRNERQRISSEIHDDIGSGLFAIQLFADMASKTRSDIKEIKEISVMVNDMSEKINEIIWSTNSESDTLENLLYYIEHQAIKLFEYTNIHFKPDFPIDIPNMQITTCGRRNAYLLIKEIVYNAIKHAKASHVSLKVKISNSVLIFTIKDNGIGYNPNEIRQNAMGLKNISARISQLNGNMVMENYKGTLVLIKVPLSCLILTK